MIIAIFFIAVFFYWISNEENVVAGGQQLISKYKLNYQNESDYALTELKAGNIAPLIATLENWHDIDKGDRIYPLKRRLLSVLARELNSKERYEELRYWADIWHKLDDRDLTAKAYWFNALRHSDDRRDEGVNGIVREWQNFPREGTLNKFHTEIAIESNDAKALSKIIAINKDSFLKLKWQAFWKTDGGFSAKDSTSFLVTRNSEGHLSFSISLPKNTTQLRIDLPAVNSIGIKITNIRVQANNIDQLIPNSAIHSNQMKRTGHWFEAMNATDPFVYFDVKELLKNYQGKKIRISVESKFVFPWLGESTTENNEDQYQGQADQALAKLKQGKLEATIELLTLWQQIDNSALALRLKRALLPALLQALHTQQRFSELLHWSTVWHALDEQDITAKAYWFDALRHSSASEEEGYENLSSEWQRFPTNLALTNFYAEAAVFTDDTETLQKIMTVSKEALYEKEWQAFWNTGKGFNAKESTRFTVSVDNNSQTDIELSDDYQDLLNFSLQIPNTASQLRIDLPASLNFQIKISNIQLQINDVTHDIPTQAIKSHDLERIKDDFKTTRSKDPFLYFDVTSYFGEQAVESINISLQSTIVFPWLQDMQNNNGAKINK